MVAAGCLSFSAADAEVFWVGDNTRLNARSGPGVDHEKVMQLTPGTRLHEQERRSDWSRVLLADGQEVWVHNGYIVDHSTFMQGRIVDSCVGIANCERIFTCNDNTEGIRTKTCFFVNVSNIGGKPLAEYSVGSTGTVLVPPEQLHVQRDPSMCLVDQHLGLSGRQFGRPPPVAAAYCNAAQDPKCDFHGLYEFREGVMAGGSRILGGDREQIGHSISLLEQWAAADAMMINEEPDGDNHLGQWFQKEALVPTILTYSLVREQASPESRMVIDGWINRLMNVANRPGGPVEMRRGHGSETHMHRRSGVNYTNHRYIRDQIAMYWGALTGNDLLYRQGIERYWVAIHQMRDDGSYPWESSRGFRAVGYSNLVVAMLIGMAEAALAQGHDLYGLETDDGRNIHTAVKWVVDAMHDSDVADRYARINDGAGGNPYEGRQDEGYHRFAVGWIEPYLFRFPDHPNSVRLREFRISDDAYDYSFEKPLAGPRRLLERRPHIIQYVGGNTSCIYGFSPT